MRIFKLVPIGCAIVHKVVWNDDSAQDVAELFDYLVDRIPVASASRYCEDLLTSTDPLAEFPKLYESAPEYGEGVRRLPRPDGRLVLYEVDDEAQEVRILAVVGPRQLVRPIR